MYNIGWFHYENFGIAEPIVRFKPCMTNEILLLVFIRNISSINPGFNVLEARTADMKDNVALDNSSMVVARML